MLNICKGFVCGKLEGKKRNDVPLESPLRSSQQMSSTTLSNLALVSSQIKLSSMELKSSQAEAMLYEVCIDG